MYLAIQPRAQSLYSGVTDIGLTMDSVRLGLIGSIHTNNSIRCEQLEASQNDRSRLNTMGRIGVDKALKDRASKMET